jgi:hypothetical protein
VQSRERKRRQWTGVETNARNKLVGDRSSVPTGNIEDWLANPARSYTSKKTHRNPRARGTATNEKSLERCVDVKRVFVAVKV